MSANRVHLTCAALACGRGFECAASVAARGRRFCSWQCYRTSLEVARRCTACQGPVGARHPPADLVCRPCRARLAAEVLAQLDQAWVARQLEGFVGLSPAALQRVSAVDAAHREQVPDRPSERTKRPGSRALRLPR